MEKINGYLANSYGFYESGRISLHKIIIPKLEKQTGIKVYEPFSICAKQLDLEYITSATSYEERQNRWKKFSEKIGPTNDATMKKSQIMIPILDGAHTVDEGVASEIAHFAAKEYGPIIALRTDFRLSENLGTTINCQLEHYIRQSGGKICTTTQEWYDSIKSAKEVIIQGNKIIF